MLSVKTYILITGMVVFIVGLVHLIRLLSGWTVMINGWEVPMWVSIVGVLAAWYLAYSAWVLSQKKNKS